MNEVNQEANQEELWNEQKIGELLGFEVKESSQESSEEKLELVEDIQPTEVEQKSSWSKNPWAKLAVIGSGTAVACGAFGFFLTTVSNTDWAFQAQVSAQDTQQETESESPSDTGEIGLLKTQLALSKQEEQLQAWDAQKKNKDKTQLVKKEDSQEENEPEPSEEVAQTPPTPQQRTVASPRPVRRVPPPQPRRVVSPQPVRRVSPPPPPEIRAIPQATSKPEIDPQQQWKILAQLGNYGSVEPQNRQPLRERVIPVANIEPELLANSSLTPGLLANSRRPNSRALPKALPRIAQRERTRFIAQVEPKEIQIPREETRITPLIYTPEMAAQFNPQEVHIQREKTRITPLIYTPEMADQLKLQEVQTQKEKTRFTSLVNTSEITAQFEPQEVQIQREKTRITPLIYTPEMAAQFEPQEAQISRENPTESPIRRLQIGQQVQGHLVTPIIWAGETQEAKERFVVQLDAPLTDTQRRTLLPTGTQIIFEVGSIHDSGLVISEAIALIRSGREYILPPGVIRIRGKGGSPLLAKIQNNARGEIARRERAIFALGALAKVGEVINRPNSSSSTVVSGTNFSSSTTTSTREADLFGAVLEGGFNPLSEEIQRRNETAIEGLADRSRLWFVESQEEVMIFVNGSFEM